MNCIIFTRVSTNQQETSRQVAELREYAEKNNLTVLKVFEEVISGATINSERPVLLSMVEFVKNNPVSICLCWELSRIGRNPAQVLLTIEELHKAKCSIYIKNFNLYTLDSDFNYNPLTNFLIQVLNSINEMERQSLVLRLRSGYKKHRDAGKPVGRKTGSIKTDVQVLRENDAVIKLLRRGFSVRNTAKLTGKSTGLVMKVKKLMNNSAKKKVVVEEN